MRKQANKSTAAEKERRNSGKFEKGNKYRFKPGVSGNSKGRPKHKTLSESLRAFLEQPVNKGKGAPTMAEAIATAILEKARRGEVRAFEVIRDTVEGKPPQRVEMVADPNEHERQRQVKFLTRTIKTVQTDGVSVEEIWQYVEQKERDMFGEDISQLKPLVMAALGVGDEKTHDVQD